jgi:streptogramin lyase
MPGRVYVSDPPPPELGCMLPGLVDNPRIFQYDPVSGAVSLFTVIPDSLCNSLNGLAFTPDGNHLRASGGVNILQIDSAGNVGVALGPANGIFAGGSGNNIAYDNQGNFFVVNANGQILQFAPGSTTPAVFAGPSPLNFGPGPIATAPNGDLYYAVAGAQAPYNAINRFTPEGEGSVFDVPNGSLFINSLTMSSAGELFVLAQTGVFSHAIYRYTAGEPGSETLFVSNQPVFNAAVSLALSPDESHLYVATNLLYSIDVNTGESEILATGVGLGTGAAVYVPEPTSLPLLLGVLALVSVRSRRA